MKSSGRSWRLGRRTVVAATVLGLACGRTRSAPVVEPADLVLKGGKIRTVAEGPPVVEAMAVRGPWIIALGTVEEIEPLVGSRTRIVELGGRLAVPGFIEGHGHFLSLGRAKTILDLTGATSWEAIVAGVEAAVARAEPGEWIEGRGWHQEKWARPPSPAVAGAPVHYALSAVSPDNPVLLGHASGHAALANAKAMELAGLTSASQAPPGGELVRDEKGRLTGFLREAAQQTVREVLDRARTDRTPEELAVERRRRVELAGREALSKGVTSFHDAGVSFEEIDFYRQLEAERSLPVRLYVMVGGQTSEELAARLASYRMVAEGDDFLAVRSIKRVMDGALGSHGAWLLEPYEDLPESVGLVLDSEEELRATAEAAVRQGFQLSTHAIGDRANRRALDIYQAVFAAHGDPPDLRWRIEHAQHLHPDDIERFRHLGVIASMQGIHCTSDGPWVLKRLGASRAESGAYVWRKLLDSGALVTNGTDVPVEDIDPIASFYASVARRLEDGTRFYPQQRMTREETLRSYTADNAYAAFEERLKGSLEVGKLADLAVLSKDIMTIAEEEIPTARVDLTIVGGEIRYVRTE